MNNELAETITFAPQVVSKSTLEMLDRRRKDPDSGVMIGIDTIDLDVIPLVGGDLTTILGRPGNGKTYLMLYIARNETRRILEEERTDEVVVYGTWETSMEESGLIHISSNLGIDPRRIASGDITDDEWRRLQKSAMERASIPLWVIGHSILKRKKRPGLTLTDVAEGLQWIEEEQGKKIRMIVLDYLQRITPERGNDRRLQVSDNVERIKNMALAMGCPVILGCQASRDVDQRKIPMPNSADGSETANIEQTSDKGISLFMPKNYKALGSTMDVGGRLYDVTPNLMFAFLFKQRYAKSGIWYPLYVDFERTIIQGMDVHTQTGIEF